MTDIPVLGAMRALRRMAEVVASRGPIEPLEIEDLEQAGALAYIEAYPAGRTNPNRYALRRAEGIMQDMTRAHRAVSAKRTDGTTVVAWSDAASYVEVMREPGKVVPAKVRRAIRSLRKPYRSVLWALYVGHEGGTELALRLGRSPNTIYTWQHRGLAMLRNKMLGVRS